MNLLRRVVPFIYNINFVLISNKLDLHVVWDSINYCETVGFYQLWKSVPQLIESGLNDVEAGQAGSSTYIQVTVFFPFGAYS